MHKNNQNNWNLKSWWLMLSLFALHNVRHFPSVGIWYFDTSMHTFINVYKCDSAGVICSFVAVLVYLYLQSVDCSCFCLLLSRRYVYCSCRNSCSSRSLGSWCETLVCSRSLSLCTTKFFSTVRISVGCCFSFVSSRTLLSAVRFSNAKNKFSESKR